MRHVILICLLLASCATPVPPSGGPRDETPPEIVEMVPEAGAVNVDRETLRITFSEYVDESSFAQAFSMTPSFARQPEFVWGRRTVEAHFPEALRENTTYVVTLDTRLRDIHGVAVSGPMTLAFSTGPTISAGAIGGQVVTAQGGRPAAGVDVFAYAAQDTTGFDDVPERPAYRTQTDQSGAFLFEYLTEQPYYVVALQDLNRNLQPDASEAFAPPPIAPIMADTTPVELGLPWVLIGVDSTRPEPIRAESIAQTRHRLRFSEPVRFAERDPSAWLLVDSTTTESLSIRTLYIRPSEPREVHFTTPALSSNQHSITPAAVVDSSGNLVVREAVGFTPSAAEDTLQLRFLGFLPPDAATLAPNIQPGLRFNSPLDQDRLAEVVSVQDSVGTPLVFSVITENGTEYRILPEPALGPGSRVQVSVRGDRLGNVDSTFVREYARIPRSETGELSGVVLAEGDPIIVQAAPVEVPIPVDVPEVRADSAGRFMIERLPAGTYRLRAFVDEDGDDVWDGGSLIPYQSPEAIVWRDEPVRVRARWETSLPDTIRIPSPQPPETP